MAKKVAEMQVENTVVGGSETTRGQGHRRGRSAIGVIAVLLAVLLIGGAVLHDRQIPRPRIMSEQRSCTPFETSSPCDQSSMQADTAEAAPQAPGVTGCNDEMLCLSMYSPRGVSVPYMEDFTPQTGQNR